MGCGQLLWMAMAFRGAWRAWAGLKTSEVHRDEALPSAARPTTSRPAFFPACSEASHMIHAFAEAEFLYSENA